METFVPGLGQGLFFWNRKWQYLWTPWNLLASFFDKGSTKQEEEQASNVKTTWNGSNRPFQEVFFISFGKERISEYPSTLLEIASEIGFLPSLKVADTSKESEYIAPQSREILQTLVSGEGNDEFAELYFQITFKLGILTYFQAFFLAVLTDFRFLALVKVEKNGGRIYWEQPS